MKPGFRGSNFADEGYPKNFAPCNKAMYEKCMLLTTRFMEIPKALNTIPNRVGPLGTVAGGPIKVDR